MPGAAPVPGSCSGAVQSRVVGRGVEHEWLLRFLFERVTAVTELAFGQVQAPIGLYGAERTKLTHVAAGCRNIVVTVTKATIVHTGGTSGRGASGDLASHPPASSYDCPAKALIKGNESSMIYHPRTHPRTHRPPRSSASPARPARGPPGSARPSIRQHLEAAGAHCTPPRPG